MRKYPCHRGGKTLSLCDQTERLWERRVAPTTIRMKVPGTIEWACYGCKNIYQKTVRFSKRIGSALIQLVPNPYTLWPFSISRQDDSSCPNSHLFLNHGDFYTISVPTRIEDSNRPLCVSESRLWKTLSDICFYVSLWLAKYLENCTRIEHCSGF